MNCREALDILEAVHPCSDDLKDPQFAEAVAWLNSDEECARLFAARQKNDLQIFRAMSDVAVPAGLKKEIIASLGLNTSLGLNNSQDLNVKQASPIQVAPVPSSPPRRRWLWVMTSSVVCAFVGLGLWHYFSMTNTLFEMGDLQQLAAQQMGHWDELPNYSGPFSNPKTTLGYQWTNGDIGTTSAPKGLLPINQSNHAIALFGFQLSTKTTAQFDGMLMIIDVNSVSHPPEANYFSSSRANYIITSQGKFKTVTWREADRVFICIVRDSDTLDMLESALSSSPA